MPANLDDLVRRRARNLCEYCRLPQAYSRAPFELDHIIARKHGGKTNLSNCAWSCFYCNSFKGSDLSSLDPKTRRLTRLFHPRRHKWSQHFRWNDPILVGRTAVGRTTIAVLRINLPARVDHRASLIAEGHFPPN
jgi:hypothetical protein